MSIDLKFVELTADVLEIFFIENHRQAITRQKNANRNERLSCQEFGGAGCMDAAYALGLWRAGSSFQVVEGATLTPMDPTVSSQVRTCTE